MEQLTKEEQREVDYRQMVFPMRQFHKETGAVRVFFSLDEWLMHERNYSAEKSVAKQDAVDFKRGPGRPRMTA